MTILVTGGAGFIGSNFIIDWFKNNNEPIINIDKLTYASNHSNIDFLLPQNELYTFIHGDICNKDILTKIFSKNDISAVINFAAESHVDKSIQNPSEFIKTNIIGTFELLEISREYIKKSNKNFKFMHISTDEVFGDLNQGEPSFSENNSYKPNSPYSASKASSDHLVRAYNKTYKLPTLITNCSNNYGPYQYPEKLIPLTIKNLLKNEGIPLYGDGSQIRDWLYVGDHCSALRLILDKGKVGKTYNIGGDSEKTNLEVVSLICEILDKLIPSKNLKSYKELICFVEDRPGHDTRYAIDSSFLKSTLGWNQSVDFKTGIKQTIQWYLNNPASLSEEQIDFENHWLKKSSKN